MARAHTTTSPPADAASEGSSDDADTHIHTLANVASARWHDRRDTEAPTHSRLERNGSSDHPNNDVTGEERSSGPSRHDRRASKACQACRARKTRCDAQQPKCSYCHKNNVDCHYVAGDLRKERPSKRRRSSARQNRLADDSASRSASPSHRDLATAQNHLNQMTTNGRSSSLTDVNKNGDGGDSHPHHRPRSQSQLQVVSHSHPPPNHQHIQSYSHQHPHAHSNLAHTHHAHQLDRSTSNTHIPRRSSEYLTPVHSHVSTSSRNDWNSHALVSATSASQTHHEHERNHHSQAPLSQAGISSQAPAWPSMSERLNDTIMGAVPDANSPNSHFLPNELIEALSGKVAWFDELERQSNASGNDATPLSEHSASHPVWSTASDLAAFDPMLADLLHQPSSLARTGSGKDRIIQLHYFRSFGGATAVTQGLKKISVRIRVPAELESMLIEAQNRSSFFDPASTGLDPQTLNLHSLLGTSRVMQSANFTTSMLPNGLHATDVRIPPALSPPAYPEDLPDAPLRDLLLTRFFLRLGDHFPFISRSTLEAQLARGSQVNPALINAMCALAARFVEPYETGMLSPSAGAGGSTAGGNNDGDIGADSGLGSSKPHSRGLRFAEKAKSYMMSSITLPSVTTVATLVLLAWHEFGVNSDSGLWMFAGMALRMSIDLGLHRKAKKNWFAALPAADPTGELIEPQQLFWCVFNLDRTLSIGTGRPTSLKDQEITLDYPPLTIRNLSERSSGGDATSESGGSSSRKSKNSTPSVFGHLTRLMQKAGALAEIANNLGEEDDPQPLEELDKLEAHMITDYDTLPSSLTLGEEQFRSSPEPRCLLSLHLGFHNLLMLMNRLPLSRLRADPVGSDESREILRHASQQIRNAVLYANAVDPNIHLACPFTNQSFCLAGGFEASMAATLQRQEQFKASHRRHNSTSTGTDSGRASPAPRSLASLRAKIREDASGKGARSLFVQSHLEAYQRCVDALDKLTETWLGVTWIANALKARKTEEGHEVGQNSSQGGGGGGGSAETMLSHSELKVLLRLAASTVSSTEQPMSIIEESTGSVSASAESNSNPSWGSPPSVQGKQGGSAALSHSTSQNSAARPATGSAMAAPMTSAFQQPAFGQSVPQQQVVSAGGPFQHVEISDISHPDDLSHFLPFLTRPMP